jgi:hypothetical protein
MKKLEKNQGRLDQLQLMALILPQWCRLVGSSNPKPPLLGNKHGIVPAHRRGHQNGQSFWYIFSLSFCLLLPRQLLGQYRASSHPMSASSGFWSSPGHAALGDVLPIAPADRHGHQNDQWWRNMLMPSLILSSKITVAKYHVLVSIN